MLQQMWELLTTRWSFFANLLVQHIEISLAAIAIAIVVGGIVGILIAAYQRAAKPTLAVINILYTIPSISMLGFLIPFTGIGDATAIIALTIYALLPMVRNTHTGLTNVDPAILEAATGMGSTRRQTLFRVQLPLALPYIMGGIRSMVVMTISLGGIASFIGAGGLGVAIYRGITTNNAAMTIDGSLLIALLALVADGILGFVEHRMALRDAKSKRANRRMGVVAAVAAAGMAAAVAIPALVPHAATIHVATKPMTEQYIMGNMLKDLIEQDTDLNVELTTGVGGGTSNIEPAMESGEFDLYPEYTGTGWNLVLGEEGVFQESDMDELTQRYHDEKGLDWRGMWGFKDAYGLVVRTEIAEQYDLHTYSDLARVAPQLTFGAEYDFYEKEHGYQDLCDEYGLSFKNTVDLDIGLKYEALAQKQIDVMVVFTSDGQLSQADAVVLEDDRGFFPADLCGNVVRDETLQEHPELEAVFDKVTDSITDDEMAQMNYEVETEGKDPTDVARDFLQQKGLLS